MSNNNESTLIRFAEAITTVDPTISLNTDEIVDKIKTIGLKSFIATAGVGIRELFETFELMSNLNDEVIENES